MSRFVVLSVTGLMLAACQVETPEPPPVMVASDPGETACRNVAAAGNMEVRSVSGPEFITESGSVSGARYTLRVRQGGRGDVVRCNYSYDSGQARLVSG